MIMNASKRSRAALHGTLASLGPLAEDTGEVLPLAPARLPVEGNVPSLDSATGGSTLGR
jgi:hypothetical protein